MPTMTISRGVIEMDAHQQLLATLPAMLCACLGDACVVTLASDRRGPLYPVAVGHREPCAAAALDTLLQIAPDALVSAFARRALETSGSIWMPTVTSDVLRLWTPPGFWDYLAQHAVHSLLVAALPAAGGVSGTLTAWRESASPAYDAEDDRFLRSFARRLGRARAMPTGRQRVTGPARVGRPHLRLVQPYS
jgi:hypothetical protein